MSSLWIAGHNHFRCPGKRSTFWSIWRALKGIWEKHYFTYALDKLLSLILKNCTEKSTPHSSKNWQGTQSNNCLHFASKVLHFWKLEISDREILPAIQEKRKPGLRECMVHCNSACNKKLWWVRKRKGIRWFGLISWIYNVPVKPFHNLPLLIRQNKQLQCFVISSADNTEDE